MQTLHRARPQVFNLHITQSDCRCNRRIRYACAVHVINWIRYSQNKQSICTYSMVEFLLRFMFTDISDQESCCPTYAANHDHLFHTYNVNWTEIRATFTYSVTKNGVQLNCVLVVLSEWVQVKQMLSDGVRSFSLEYAVLKQQSVTSILLSSSGFRTTFNMLDMLCVHSANMWVPH